MSKKPDQASIAINKKARHLYDLSDFMEAGIALSGPEVKSVRAGRVNFIDSYVDFRGNEAWLHSLHIAPYANAGYAPQDPDRSRRLLLHAREIRRLASLRDQKGFSVVPTRLYFKNRRVKVEIALGKGRKLHDHRDALKRKAVERDMEREAG